MPQHRNQRPGSSFLRITNPAATFASNPTAPAFSLMVERSSLSRRTPGLNLAYHPTKIGRRRGFTVALQTMARENLRNNMKTSLPQPVSRTAVGPLDEALASFALRYPGETGHRQPVHTVYGGAHLFQAGTARRLGDVALAALGEYAPDAFTFARAAGLPGAEKLPNSASQEVARGMSEGSLPPFIGIRIKPFSTDLRERSIRTLDLFVSTLYEATHGRIPEHFVVTLPKVVIPEQPAALAGLLEALENVLGVEKSLLRFEVMIETTQAILNERGESNLPRLLDASTGRCVAAHFGTYDYTASCSITAAYQTMTHPACDFAKHMMQVAFASTGIWLSDGATNILPAPPHRVENSKRLTRAQRDENKAAVHRAWRLHYEHIQHSLVSAYYQGWDLHPAQLPTRYAALYSFFLEGLDSAAARLKNFVDKAAQATLAGDVFDDAATGQGLLNYFLRAINCGAISEAVAERLTGVTPEELHLGSFLKILKNRTK